MAIDTSGMVSVAEAAERLNLSQEQVRRKLREGKLKGQRVGNQWFVESAQLSGEKKGDFKPLIPREIMEQVRRTKEKIHRENPGYNWDGVEMVRRSRGEA